MTFLRDVLRRMLLLVGVLFTAHGVTDDVWWFVFFGAVLLAVYDSVRSHA